MDLLSRLYDCEAHLRATLPANDGGLRDFVEARSAVESLVGGLRRIANHPANLTGAPQMERIARETLERAGITP